MIDSGKLDTIPYGLDTIELRLQSYDLSTLLHLRTPYFNPHTLL